MTSIFADSGKLTPKRVEQNSRICCSVPGSWRAELVAGKADDREALAGELPLQLLETRILRRVPAPACHVDRKHDLTTQRVQKIGRAVDPGHAVVEESRHEAPPV